MPFVCRRPATWSSSGGLTPWRTPRSFASELVDVEVYADGARIGKIKEVLDYPGNSVYVVQGEREYLIPAVKEFILSTDLERNQMQVKLLKGMASDED